MRRRQMLGLMGIFTAACSRSGAPQERAGAPGRLRVAVIPKGTTHEFWKSVHAGAVKAARELDVDITWKGPLEEDDLRGQIDLVQSFTAQRVSGIALAPLNDKALVNSVRAATAAGIPVVIFDSALSGADAASFVATDNRAAGALAAERLIQRVSGPGKVVVLRYQEGSASTREREEGFLARLAQQQTLTVVSDNQYGGATTESAFEASERLLLAQSAAGGGVTAVFTPNESTTFGMLLALRKAGLAGKVRHIGFDVSDKLLAALKAGEIDALVLQNPFNMGYLAVRTVVERLRGQAVAARTDTGARLVDANDLHDPSIAELVAPDLEKWLGSRGVGP